MLRGSSYFIARAPSRCAQRIRTATPTLFLSNPTVATHDRSLLTSVLPPSNRTPTLLRSSRLTMAGLLSGPGHASSVIFRRSSDQSLSSAKTSASTASAANGSRTETMSAVATRDTNTTINQQSASNPNPPHPHFNLLTLLTGLCMGFFGGVAGLGGGVVCVPMLTGLVNFPQHHAHGTSLVAVTTTALVGSYSYYRFGGGLECIDVPGAVILALSASISSSIGAYSTKFIKAKGLKLGLGLFMMLAAVLIAFKDSDSESSTVHGQKDGAVQNRKVPDSISELIDAIDPARDIPFYGTIGCITGFCSGMMGVGGGVIMMPLLSIFGGIPQKTALATSLLAMAVPSALGARVHHSLGNVVWRAIPQLLIGTSIGAYSAGFFSSTLTNEQQKLLIGVIMAGLGTHTIYRFKLAK